MFPPPRLLAAIAVVCGCARPVTVAPPGQPPARQAPDLDRPRLVADTTGLRAGVPPADLTLPGARDSLRAVIAAQHAAWRGLGVADYDLLVRAACFCPGGGGGWHTLEVRSGIPTRVWDARGTPVPVREWSSYSINGLFELLDQALARNEGMGVRWDDRWHYPAFVSTDFRRGLPDDWGTIEVAGFTQRTSRRP